MVPTPMVATVHLNDPDVLERREGRLNCPARQIVHAAQSFPCQVDRESFAARPTFDRPLWRTF